MKINFSKVFNNNRYLMIFSVIMSIVLWLVVAMVIDKDQPMTIKNKEVDISAQTSTLDPLNLSVVDGGALKVDVQVLGERYIVGGVLSEDITVVADLSGIAGPGTYDVRLNGYDKYTKGFGVIKITPPTARIKLDRVVTKKFPIQARIDGLTIPENYIVEDEYISPKEVSVTGPENDVALIDKCVVEAKFTQPLTKTSVTKNKITFYDKEGNLIENELFKLDTDMADLTIPVLKRTRVPVRIEFVNVPPNFPVEELSYTLSNEFIDVAGPSDVVDSLTEIVQYIDIKQLGLGSIYSFDVTLPAGFINIENIQSATVAFNTEGMVEKYFDVTNVNIINAPFAYDVTLIGAQTNKVLMIGPEEVISGMTSDDIVGEIDLRTIGADREITEGNFSVPVKIYAPGKQLVWANGEEYTAVINFKLKE